MRGEPGMGKKRGMVMSGSGMFVDGGGRFRSGVKFEGEEGYVLYRKGREGKERRLFRCRCRLLPRRL